MNNKTGRIKNTLLLIMGIFFFGILFIQSSSGFPHDLRINLQAIQNFQQTGTLYTWSPASKESLYYSFISSPFIAMILFPFASLPVDTAVALYRLLSVIVYIAAIMLLSSIEILKINSRTTKPGWSWLIMLVWLSTQDSLTLGQLNEAILLCLVIAYWGWVTKHDTAAGIGVGIAAALKITPILLVLLFLFSRRWRAASVAIAVAAVLGGISCASVGVNQCVAFGTVIFPNISRGSADYYHIGLNGLWYRLLTATDTAYWTNLRPPPELFIGRVIPLIELVTFVAAGYFTTRRLPKSIQGRSALFALWIAGMLLSAPITWWHYSIWLLVGVPTLVEYALKSKRHSRLVITAGLVLINLSPYILLGIGTLSGSPFLTYMLLVLPCLGLIILTAVFWRIQSKEGSVTPDVVPPLAIELTA